MRWISSPARFTCRHDPQANPQVHRGAACRTGCPARAEGVASAGQPACRHDRDHRGATESRRQPAAARPADRPHQGQRALVGRPGDAGRDSVARISDGARSVRKRGARFNSHHRNGGPALLAKHQSIQALARPLSEQEEAALLVPARLALSNLLDGSARSDDLHAVTALINVGMLLAHAIGEHPACAAIEAGNRGMLEVKSRPGPRYAMNAAQREAIVQAVQLTDELFGVSSLLEIYSAYRRVLAAYDRRGGSGNLERVEI